MENFSKNPKINQFLQEFFNNNFSNDELHEIITFLVNEKNKHKTNESNKKFQFISDDMDVKYIVQMIEFMKILDHKKYIIK